MHTTYVYVIGAKFPNVQVSCAGDPDVYEDLKYEGGDPMPTKDQLDAAKIEIIKLNAWENLKAYRDMRKAGGVKVGDYWFHSDDASRIQQIALTMLGSNMPANLQWKTMTGAFVTMTPTLASQIFQTSIQSDTTIFGIAENHRQAMLSSSDPENYDFSGGWPITYAESPEYVA